MRTASGQIASRISTPLSYRSCSINIRTASSSGIPVEVTESLDAPPLRIVLLPNQTLAGDVMSPLGAPARA
ncbi:MAG TPA: hypothetical protein VEO54_09445 [Thermoanaerobaculia bacterium]|nr:hypothetical protein [Thermoanaerobaculia bacterium]